MNALLTKNLMIVKKSMALQIVIAIALALYGNQLSFVFCGMIPITAIAYDQNSKWNEIATTLPYSKSTLNLSYYVLGYLLIVPAVILMIISVNVLPIFDIMPKIDYSEILTFACIATIYMSICIPASLYFGVEKGRIVNFTLIVVGVVAYSVLMSIPEFSEIFTKLITNFTTILFVIATILVNVISMLFSKNIKVKR